MPRKDLRALFHTNLADLDAVQVFADRDDERMAFDQAYAAYRDQVHKGHVDPHDMVAPRRNVVVFYGVGGVGKTTMSRQLQARLTEREAQPPAGWPPLAEDLGTVLAVRLDLSREAALDVEGLILLLRAAVAPLRRPMVAFDLALARYWKRAHCESLADYLRRPGFERMPQVAQVPDLVTQAVSEVSSMAGLVGVGLLVQTGPKLIGYLRDRSRRRHIVEECQCLPDLLEAEASVESLTYYPHLLAWDLAQIQRDRDVSLAVFVDTFEEIGSRSDRELERILQRMVWLMPNVFFVITGRNRLEWADPSLADRLDWAGPVNWPGLEPGAEQDPRQHLVGQISDFDSDSYLRNRLVRHGEPVIPATVRERIVRNANGLPLYLDLSVMRFFNLYQAGHTPLPEDFDDAFPGVVARVFRDLDEHERSVLRAVSLVDAFDVDLAVAAAGLPNDAAALQLVQRAFVRYDDGAPLPYYLHELVRGHIRDADVGLDDSWSEQDRRRAAQRALDHLGEHDHAATDRRNLIAALNQGLRLAHDFDLPLGWLVDAAYRFIADSVWEPTLRPRVPDLDLAEGGPRTGAHALAAGLVAVVNRQRVHRSHTLGVLERSLDSGLLAGDAVDLLAYFRAECQRDLGLPDKSEHGMRALLGPDCRMADMAFRGLSHLQRRRGKFRELASQLAQRPPDAVWHRVYGDLWWTQGRLPEAIAEYNQAVERAEQSGLAGEAAISAACLAWATALSSPAEGTRTVRTARDSLDSVTITWADLHVVCAETLLAAGDGVEVERRCAQVQERSAACGLTSCAAYAAFARAFHYAVVGDPDGHARARALLDDLVHGDEFAYLREIVDCWNGEDSDPVMPGADWVDGRQATIRRWQGIIHTRRQQLRSR